MNDSREREFPHGTTSPSRRWGAIVVLLLLFLAFGMRTSIAEEELNHAGLVVRDQAGELAYAYVAFAEAEISSLELLERSRLPVVTVGFGGLGEAVCAIGGDGCGVSECRRRLCQGPGPDDPFWQAFRQHTPGDWRWQMLGASSSLVRDGDIDGWSWTSGEANLPALTLAEIAGLAAAQAAPAPAVEPAAIDWQLYAGAGGILVAIGSGAFLLGRRAGQRGAA
ncbi:MAG: hypothetical protein H0V24_07550 [Chloroflexia bacterium]|nr:hypothetical protein [Chloroflexia bacterium]MDQ3410627.1 hypothetical protein [Chloroflexota bacterium]